MILLDEKTRRILPRGLYSADRKTISQVSCCREGLRGPSLASANVAQLIKDGEITIGVLRPIGCVATASDGHNTLAMLVRQKGETLAPVADPARPGHRQSLHRRHLYRRDQPVAHKLKTLIEARTPRQDAAAGRLRKTPLCQRQSPRARSNRN